VCRPTGGQFVGHAAWPGYRGRLGQPRRTYQWPDSAASSGQRDAGPRGPGVRSRKGQDGDADGSTDGAASDGWIDSSVGPVSTGAPLLPDGEQAAAAAPSARMSRSRLIMGHLMCMWLAAAASEGLGAPSRPGVGRRDRSHRRQAGAGSGSRSRGRTLQRDANDRSPSAGRRRESCHAAVTRARYPLPSCSPRRPR
jgi:hypothetical protein